MVSTSDFSSRFLATFLSNFDQFIKPNVVYARVTNVIYALPGLPFYAEIQLNLATFATG
ncbi:hypothetical protein RB2150_03933 [Rhodobacterales bacterium HTCC2150]|nr:hypothetical protein RB2150_03933 [Rhodobacterales bacterium HTCC2150] [Rhodobacteraceae bacterium HTCC2150]